VGGTLHHCGAEPPYPTRHDHDRLDFPHGMLRSTPAQTPSRTVERSRCHRALGLLSDDHLTFVSHVNESLRASTAEARPDTCCTDFTEGAGGGLVLDDTLVELPAEDTSEHLPAGPGTATAAEHPRLGRPLPWPASQQRSWWAVEQPGRAPETSWPRASPAIACLFTPTRIRDSPVLIWDWPTASRSFFTDSNVKGHDGRSVTGSDNKGVVVSRAGLARPL
jgi:hypothetical protein